MNATGEFELINWYDRIASLQNDLFRPILIKIMHLAMLNIWGKIDKDITFDFVKLKETSPIEDAQIRYTDAQRDTLYVSDGTLHQSDVRNRLANDPNSGYNELMLEEEDYENLVSPDMPEETESQKENEEIIIH
jgi:hypothetical protein